MDTTKPHPPSEPDDTKPFIGGAVDPRCQSCRDTSVPVRKLRASVHYTLGGYYDKQKQYPKVVAEYTAALTEYEWLARRFESTLIYRYQQATLLYFLAIATSQNGDEKDRSQTPGEIRTASRRTHRNRQN